MKYGVLIFFLFIVHTSQAQVNVIVKFQDVKSMDTRDTIFYQPSRKLTWKDFKGAPDYNSWAAAITASGFGYSMSMQSLGRRAVIEINVTCFFTRKQSWVKPRMDSEYALLHEQHHFDVTYIAAMQFVQRLKAANFTLQNYEKLLDKIHEESYADLEKMQNEYDGQTRNGRSEDIQKQWNKRIDGQLAMIATN